MVDTGQKDTTTVGYESVIIKKNICTYDNRKLLNEIHTP